jgi:prolipoprotein diacylglyceryltransferase
VLPTQPFETGYTFLLAGALYLFWKNRALCTPGLTMATTMWIYGILRFINEGLRDDNPFEYAWWAVYKGGTISQNISLYMIAAGVILTIWFVVKSPKCQQRDKKRP